MSARALDLSVAGVQLTAGVFILSEGHDPHN